MFLADDFVSTRLTQFRLGVVDSVGDLSDELSLLEDYSMNWEDIIYYFGIEFEYQELHI